MSGPERGAYSYRNLDLWQRAQELALGVVKMSESLPRSEAARSIARQVVSSSGSVAANIAEGHGRYSVAAYRNHLSIARGSVAETDSWVDPCEGGLPAPGYRRKTTRPMRRVTRRYHPPDESPRGSLALTAQGAAGRRVRVRVGRPAGMMLPCSLVRMLSCSHALLLADGGPPSGVPRPKGYLHATT